MKDLAVKIIKSMRLYYPLRNWVTSRRQRAELVAWEKNGKPMPPPHLIKQGALREYARRYGLRVLVETGTYYGDMVQAMKSEFDRIYSIELSQDLYEKALTRFKGAEKIELIQGDSGVQLGRIMDKINQPALFWLDGHYSEGVTARGEKDTPIYEELRHILGATFMGHVIIVDDARCFGVDPAYPSLAQLEDFVKSMKSNMDMTVQGDSIRITPGL
jgi:hypothetical protein